MATPRDVYCITWLAEQYAARTDQVRRILSRFPGKPLKDGNTLIAETTLKDQLLRWRRAGWVEYRRVLADMPGWVWVTKKGLALVGLGDVYVSREPASTRLDHLYAVNQLRLWMEDAYGYEWKSERRYRAEELNKQAKKGESSGPIPDALITVEERIIAIEVELTAKKPTEMVAKLLRLLHHYVDDGIRYQPAFPTIWFYVPDEKMQQLVESAIERLAVDQQKRVGVAVQPSLRASRFR